MKRKSRQLTAVLTAVAILISLCAMAGAASPPQAAQHPTHSEKLLPHLATPMLPPSTLTGEITKLPDSMTFMLNLGSPDLRGMEFTVSGSAFDSPQSFRVDENLSNPVMQLGNVAWYSGMYPYADSWTLGDNRTELNFHGYQYTKFIEVTQVDGVPYGYFQQDYIGSVRFDITFTALPFDSSVFNGAAQLELDGAPAAVDLSQSNHAWYKFTAPADGHYSFISNGGRYDTETLYSINGEQRVLSSLDPYASLFDAQGNLLQYSDDDGSTYNFALYQELKKDETVYLSARLYNWNTSPQGYTILVSSYDPVLPLQVTEVEMFYNETLRIEDLLAGTSLRPSDVYIRGYYEHFDSIYEYDWDTYREYQCLVAKQGGRAVITVHNHNGGSAEVTVKISYTPAQQFCRSLLLGDLWLPYVPAGVTGGFADLVRMGLSRALYEFCSSSLDLPYWSIHWLTKFF